MATFLRTRATLQLIGQSTPSLITRYWDSTGAAIGLLATEAVARDRAFFGSLSAVLTAGAIYTPNLVVDEIEETTGALVNQVAAAAPAAIAFTGSGDGIPYAMQALVRLGTNSFIGGRRVQGRQFIPGFLEASSTGNPPQPSTGLLTSIQTAANLLGTTIVTPIGQRVWHRPGGATPGLSVPVISRSVSPQWAVLKSRRI